MNPWELIPQSIQAALKEIPELHLLPREKWQFRLEAHPYPSTDLPSSEIRETIIRAQLRGLTAPNCWVDAGTGQSFLGAFPMTSFGIKLPSGEPLEQHQEWVKDRLKEMQDQALGVKRSRHWEVLYMTPLTDEQGQCNLLLGYGAYASVDHRGHIALRDWAERNKLW